MRDTEGTLATVGFIKLQWVSNSNGWIQCPTSKLELAAAQPGSERGAHPRIAQESPTRSIGK